jgi:hypothetical protein
VTHFFTWRVTPILHGGALTLGMDIVKIWRHISRIYGRYLIIFEAHFVEVIPFYEGFNNVKHHLIVFLT